MSDGRPTHLDLFSGIGGFALAARWAGFRTVGFCEIDKYCQKVIAKNFLAYAECERNGNERPREVDFSKEGLQGEVGKQWIWPDIGERISVRIIPNIFDLDGRQFFGVTLLTGGFPCQPFSVAGKRRGAADNRAIWPEMFRVIKEARPAWVLGENVPGIIPMELDNVLSDLERVGYACRTFVIPACAVDARHRRDRLWIVGRRMADADSKGLEGRSEAIRPKEGWNADTRYSRTQVGSNGRNCKWLPEPNVGRVVARLSPWLDGSGRINEPEVLRAMREFDGSTTLEEWRTRLDFFKTPILLQSLLWRLDNGTQQVAHESCVKEASAKGVPENDELRTMRVNRQLAKASSESQRCVLCGDPLSAMPHEGGNVFGQMGQMRNRVNRLKGLGNAIVPQVAYEILREIRKLC